MPKLYGKVLIPTKVQQELSDKRWPAVVQNSIKNPPNWLSVVNVDDNDEPDLEVLDAGEKAGIILAEQQGANLTIFGDGLGRKIARSRGLRVTGLLGLLNDASQQNLVSFPNAISRLQQTTFFASEKLIQSLLKQYQ